MNKRRFPVKEFPSKNRWILHPAAFDKSMTSSRVIREEPRILAFRFWYCGVDCASYRNAEHQDLAEQLPLIHEE